MKEYKKEFVSKNVLITGGAGFIGSNLAHELVKLNANVTIADCLLSQQGGSLNNLHGIIDQVKFNEVDVREKAAIGKLVENIDFVFHLAAQTSHIGSMEDPFADFDINCRGTLTLLESCRKRNSEAKIVYTGTRSQYGKIISIPIDETHPTIPADANGISKLAAENYCILYNNVYGIKSTSLRLTNTYGPRHQMKNARLGFINWFVRLAMDDDEIKVFDGKQLRDVNYVSDVVEALLMVAISDKANGEVFNVGSGKPISIIDIAESIVKTVGKGKIKIVPYPEKRKPIEVGDYVANISKIRKLIGWKPKIDLKEGLRMTVDFYAKNKSKYW